MTPFLVMGDMADWTINQGIAAEAQQIESWSKAKKLSDAEIVESLINYGESDENILDVEFTAKVQSICKWFKDKGFLTSKQRNCLNAAFVDVHLSMEEI